MSVIAEVYRPAGLGMRRMRRPQDMTAEGDYIILLFRHFDILRDSPRRCRGRELHPVIQAGARRVENLSGAEPREDVCVRLR